MQTDEEQGSPTLPTVRTAPRRTVLPDTLPTQAQRPTMPKKAIKPESGKHVVIMGAGPAGLTAAYELTRHNVSLTVLEADPRYVGGISRTVEYQGYRFDIGGHRFFSKSQEIEDLWSEILGDELLNRPRLSRILYHGTYFDYPLKAANALFGLGIVETVRCLLSYAKARLHPVRDPQNLEEWVSNQFGQRLFAIFFKTYTEKVWGISTKELSPDWAAQRIKGLNMSAAIKNALFPKKRSDKGELLTTLIEQFRYPRLGPGQMWERAQAMIQERGQRVELGQEVIRLHHDGQRVTSVVVRDVATDEERQITGTHFLSTLPMRTLVERCEPPLPPTVRQAANSLKYRDYLTVAMLVNQAEVFPDNWIYLHDPSVRAGRIQNFKNWSPAMVPDPRKTCLGLEYFCFEHDGLWSMADEELIALAGRELVQLGMCLPEDLEGGVVVRQAKAYPVYDDVYKQHLSVIRLYAQQHLTNLQLVGRNGMHHYNNQDHSMMTALLAARNIALGTTFDPWKVNTEAAYHEEAHWDDADRSGRLVPTPLPMSMEK